MVTRTALILVRKGKTHLLREYGMFEEKIFSVCGRGLQKKRNVVTWANPNNTTCLLCLRRLR